MCSSPCPALFGIFCFLRLVGFSFTYGCFSVLVKGWVVTTEMLLAKPYVLIIWKMFANSWFSDDSLATPLLPSQPHERNLESRPCELLLDIQCWAQSPLLSLFWFSVVPILSLRACAQVVSGFCRLPPAVLPLGIYGAHGSLHSWLFLVLFCFALLFKSLSLAARKHSGSFRARAFFFNLLGQLVISRSIFDTSMASITGI